VVYWVWACLPYAFVAFAQNYWMLLIPHLIACVGGAGYHPAAGELLKSLYPDRIRGRVYAWVWGVSMVIGAGVGFGLGKWLNFDEDSFRIFMPLGAGLQLLGVCVFLFLAHKSGHLAKRRYNQESDGRSTWARVVEPITHMRETLKADPVFLRYEAAYMTYGVGWMIGYALLPILVTDKLNLKYDQVSQSTYTAYLLAMVAMIVPAGMLMDRLGAVKSAAISFGMLTLYPIGLALAADFGELTIVSIWFGIAHAGASMAWMLGPVALAPTPDKVPHYVAIHATLVGIRGKVFQFVGVGLLWITGGFTVPLLVAAAAYLWSSVQMWKLDAQVQARKAAKSRGQ
jgi:MFS family permease